MKGLQDMPIGRKVRVNEHRREDGALTDIELATLREHASENALTSEEREVYSQYLKAVEATLPRNRRGKDGRRSNVDKSKAELWGIDRANSLLGIGLICMVVILVLSFVEMSGGDPVMVLRMLNPF